MVEVVFLGTAGGRYVVSTQLRASAGTVIKLEEGWILLDPGPGTLVHLAKKKFYLRKFATIIVSHAHLDHSADLNIIVDGLTEGGFKKRGSLFITEHAFNEPVLLPYLRPFLKEVVFLKPHMLYQCNGFNFKTTSLLKHGVENYGIIFEFPENKTIGFLTDTAYFEGLEKEFEGIDILVINTVLYKKKPGVLHLCFEDAKRIISTLRPRETILTHFGMTMLRANPFKLARELSQELGLVVKACYDGMKLSL